MNGYRALFPGVPATQFSFTGAMEEGAAGAERTRPVCPELVLRNFSFKGLPGTGRDHWEDEGHTEVVRCAGLFAAGHTVGHAAVAVASARRVLELVPPVAPVRNQAQAGDVRRSLSEAISCQRRDTQQEASGSSAEKRRAASRRNAAPRSETLPADEHGLSGWQTSALSPGAPTPSRKMDSNSDEVGRSEDTLQEASEVAQFLGSFQGRGRHAAEGAEAIAAVPAVNLFNDVAAAVGPAATIQGIKPAGRRGMHAPAAAIALATGAAASASRAARVRHESDVTRREALVVGERHVQRKDTGAASSYAQVAMDSPRVQPWDGVGLPPPSASSLPQNSTRSERQSGPRAALDCNNSGRVPGSPTVALTSPKVVQMIAARGTTPPQRSSGMFGAFPARTRDGAPAARTVDPSVHSGSEPPRSPRIPPKERRWAIACDAEDSSCDVGDSRQAQQEPVTPQPVLPSAGEEKGDLRGDVHSRPLFRGTGSMMASAAPEGVGDNAKRACSPKRSVERASKLSSEMLPSSAASGVSQGTAASSGPQQGDALELMQLRSTVDQKPPARLQVSPGGRKVQPPTETVPAGSAQVPLRLATAEIDFAAVSHHRYSPVRTAVQSHSAPELSPEDLVELREPSQRQSQVRRVVVDGSEELPPWLVLSDAVVGPTSPARQEVGTTEDSLERTGGGGAPSTRRGSKESTSAGVIVVGQCHLSAPASAEQEQKPKCSQVATRGSHELAPASSPAAARHMLRGSRRFPAQSSANVVDRVLRGPAQLRRPPHPHHERLPRAERRDKQASPLPPHELLRLGWGAGFADEGAKQRELAALGTIASPIPPRS